MATPSYWQKRTLETGFKKPLLRTGLQPRLGAGDTGDWAHRRWALQLLVAKMALKHYFCKRESLKDKARLQLNLIPTSRALRLAGCVRIDELFLEAVRMTPLDQEIEGHTEIFRLWKEISPKNWVTPKVEWWQVFAVKAKQRTEATCPIMQQKNRIWVWIIKIIALILHFPFIITLSLYIEPFF